MDHLGQGILGCIVFGSVARDSRFAPGDFDLLLVVNDDVPPANRRGLVREAHSLLVDRGVHRPSVRATTPRNLRSQSRSRPHFIAHLQDEGRALWYDDHCEAAGLIADCGVLSADRLTEAVLGLGSRVALLSDEGRFGGLFAAALGQLYALSRSAVICQLLLRGVHDYDWRTAPGNLATEESAFSDSLSVLHGLRPFYDARVGRAEPDEVASMATLSLYREAVSGAQRVMQA